jgi:hypothetical protein
MAELILTKKPFVLVSILISFNQFDPNCIFELNIIYIYIAREPNLFPKDKIDCQFFR